MRRRTLYSSSGPRSDPDPEATSTSGAEAAQTGSERLSGRSRQPDPQAAAPDAPGTRVGGARPRAPSTTGAPPAATAARERSGFVSRHRRSLVLFVGALLAFALGWTLGERGQRPRDLTQADIDAAVLRTLETQPLPSRATRAYDAIRPSVVRVRGIGDAGDGDDGEVDRAVGSGVVIMENGTILTNLHVVSGAKRVRVVFFDGMHSEADVVSVQPENDLAVLKARVVPDDLFPATLRGSAGLAEGDEVVAVGFPFGIGPSVSSGVVSGLRREYRSPEGQRVLNNLIQFDAAANPGSSGGPLVNMSGEVVGVVTAILNPTAQRVFIGIGFAVPIESAAGGAGLPPF
jgi:S1-C subfamily serine protease